jgi:hypothetical protein
MIAVKKARIPPDPWMTTLDMLAGSQPMSRDVRRQQIARPMEKTSSLMASTEAYGNVKISLLERISETIVTVSWIDATASNYREQMWRVGAAAQHGVCVLSGQSISRGDRIYRPAWYGRVRPENKSAMMLADTVDSSFA